jgi:hypothetical protein
MKFIVLGNLGLARLFIWASFGYVTFKEFYLYACEDPRAPTTVQPEYIWIGFMAAFLENFIEIKWFRNSQVAFTGGMPLYIQISWLTAISVIGARYLYLKFWKNYGVDDEKVVKVLKEKDN